MAQIEEIESKYAFRFPEIFRRLWNNGKLYWGEPDPNWHTVVYPKLLENPPLLLGAKDFEMLGAKAILKHEFPDYWLPDSGFVPFGMNAAGDLYAFCKKFEENGVAPIVFAPHDFNEAEVYAKDFEDFFYRLSLETANDIWREPDELDQFRSSYLKMLKAVQSYFDEERMGNLFEVYGREFTKGNDDLSSLISTDELRGTIKRELGFDRLGLKFQHMKDE